MALRYSLVRHDHLCEFPNYIHRFFGLLSLSFTTPRLSSLITAKAPGHLLAGRQPPSIETSLDGKASSSFTTVCLIPNLILQYSLEISPEFSVAHFHVIHHFFPLMPWCRRNLCFLTQPLIHNIDNGEEATNYLKKTIGDNYLSSNEPVFRELWRSYNQCQFVEDEGM